FSQFWNWATRPFKPSPDAGGVFQIIEGEPVLVTPPNPKPKPAKPTCEHDRPRYHECWEFQFGVGGFSSYSLNRPEYMPYFGAAIACHACTNGTGRNPGPGAPMDGTDPLHPTSKDCSRYGDPIWAIHYNCNDNAGKYVDSVICCPCCLDTDTGPVIE